MLSPAATDVEADSQRETIYLKLRVRLHGFLFESGLLVHHALDNSVDLALLRARKEFPAARSAGRFANGGELGWVMAIGAEVARQVAVHIPDAELVQSALERGAGDVAVALEPAREQARARSPFAVRQLIAEREDALANMPVNAGDNDAVVDCVRKALAEYLSTNRIATRHTNVAMYLRYTFAGVKHKILARLYKRDVLPLNQCLSKTRRELAAAARHCFDEERVP